MTNPLPCRYCGAPATVRKEYSDKGSAIWDVACLEGDCLRTPTTSWEKTRKAAVKMWNREHGRNEKR